MSTLLHGPSEPFLMHISSTQLTKRPHPQIVRAKSPTCELPCKAQSNYSQNDHDLTKPTQATLDTMFFSGSKKETVLTYAQVVKMGVLIRNPGGSTLQPKSVTNPNKSQMPSQAKSLQLSPHSSTDITTKRGFFT